MPDSGAVEALDVVAVVAGLVMVSYALLDAFDTLLATNISAVRWSLSGGYYRVAWKSYRWACTTVRDDRRRERLLALFGPASFIGLLLLWTSASIIGWGLVWWGLGDSFASPPGGLGASLYYSGVVYFSIGSATSSPARARPRRCRSSRLSAVWARSGWSSATCRP